MIIRQPMKKAFLFLLTIVTFILAVASGAGAEEVSRPITAWPLLYHNEEQGRAETDALFSLYHYERKDSWTRYSFGYFIFATEGDPARDFRKTSVLWPLGVYKREGEHSSSHLFPFYWQKALPREVTAFFFRFTGQGRVKTTPIRTCGLSSAGRSRGATANTGPSIRWSASDGTRCKTSRSASSCCTITSASRTTRSRPSSPCTAERSKARRRRPGFSPLLQPERRRFPPDARAALLSPQGAGKRFTSSVAGFQQGGAGELPRIRGTLSVYPLRQGPGE